MPSSVLNKQAYNEGAPHSYEPSSKDMETLSFVFERLFRMQVMRDRRYRYLNDRGILRYIDDSVKRWNGYIPPRDDLAMDWQANYFNNFTRNVVITFLAAVSSNPPDYKLRGKDKKNRIDIKRAEVVTLILKAADQRDDIRYKNIMVGLEVVTKGTCVLEIGYERIKREIREVQKYNPETGEIKYKTKEIVESSDVIRNIVPLEEMYFANIWQPDIQLQPDLCRRYRTRYAEAQRQFQHFKNWKSVQPGAYFMVASHSQQPYFKERDYADFDFDSVEIVTYENRMKDRRVILANGVILYDGPMPFHHKKYSYAVGVYEPLASDFIYGKSLPDKIASEQDIINTLWNMMVDQGLLSVYKPILTDDPDEVEDTVLVPGLIRKVANKDSYRVMNELTGPDSSQFRLLDYALKFAGDNSGPIQGGGRISTPQGGAVTANQALLAQEQARQTLGLNSRFLERVWRQVAELTLKTQLQFYSLEARLTEIRGDEAEATKDARLFSGRRIRVYDQELPDGSRGTVELRVVPETKLPSPDELDVEAEAARMQGENLHLKAVTPEYIRDIEFDIEVIPDSMYQQLKSVDRSLGMEYVKGKMALFPDVANRMELSRYWDELFDQDPELMNVQQQAVPPGGIPGLPGMGGGAPPALPGQPPPGLGGGGPSISQQIAAPQTSLREMVTGALA